MLARDWLLASPDPTPLFSAFIALLSLFNQPILFYATLAGLSGFFLWALWGIGMRAIGADASQSPRWRFFFATLLFVLATMPPNPLPDLFLDGVAGQYVLGDYLQPSTIGCLLVGSVWLAGEGRFVRSAALAAVAGAVHPTYLLGAGILTLWLVWERLREKGPLHALALAGLSLVLVLPTLSILFASGVVAADPAAPEASRILAVERIPQHALVRHWFGPVSVCKLLWLGLAIWWVRGQPLGRLLLAMLGVALALTAAQVLTGSNRFALLFPWRMSVWLVPAATAIVFSGLAQRWASGEGTASALTLAGVAMVLALLVALVDRTLSYAEVRHPSVRLVREGLELHGVGEVLVQPEWQSVRLNAPAPVYVDEKTHPYRSAAVLEWAQRLEAARAFYRASDPCDELVAIRKGRTELAYVALPPGLSLPCAGAAFLLEHEGHRLYALD